MDISALNALSNALNGIDIGESILYGRVEAYSCTYLSATNSCTEAYNPLKCVCSQIFVLGLRPSTSITRILTLHNAIMTLRQDGWKR